MALRPCQHQPWSGPIGEELIRPTSVTVDGYATIAPMMDGTPLGGMGAPSVRRAMRKWVERQRALGLCDAFIQASAVLLDCMVRFFGAWRGTYAAEMIQNRLKKGVPHLYHSVVESPFYHRPDDPRSHRITRGRKWHRFVEACAPVLGLVSVPNFFNDSDGQATSSQGRRLGRTRAGGSI